MESTRAAQITDNPLALAWLSLAAERRRAIVSLVAAIVTITAAAAAGAVILGNGLAEMAQDEPLQLAPSTDWDPNRPAMPATSSFAE